MPPKTATNLPLSALKDGAIEEMAQHAIAQALANVRDPNTSAEAKRSVIIKIDFLPAADRAAVLMDVGVSVKLPGYAPIKTLLQLKDDGRFVSGHEPEQAKIPGLAAVAGFPDKESRK